MEGVNPFYERSGQWTTTMTIAVPESQLEAELLEISVTLRDLTGRVENSGGPNPAQDQAIPGEFEAQFTLTVDRDHQFSFTSDAQSNGAKVLAVSGTPTQTVITVEKPFWGLGDSIVESQTPAQGEPYLVLSDGTQLRYDFTRSQELGSYDYQAQETQTADLYFDGLPAGADQAVLRFYGGYNQETVLAEFTIHVESQTVTPSATYEEGGLLDLSSPYRYEILQSNVYDLEGNGFAVSSVVFRNYETYTSSVFFCVPQEWAEARLKVEVYDAQDTLLWESSAYNSDGGWNEGWQSTSPEDSQLGKLEQEAGESGETRWEFSVSQELTGRMAAIGEQVTVKILDEDTGEILFTDTQTLDQVQR
ncbi:unknown [Clostridium sp. CAG:1013]|nr:unknown [Clostridium sp. CAG:1013]